jgi:hypothetical protein
VAIVKAVFAVKRVGASKPASEVRSTSLAGIRVIDRSYQATLSRDHC